MAVVLPGMFGTGEFVANERVLDWRQGILKLTPLGDCALTGILSVLPSKKTVDKEFNWWEQKLSPMLLTVNHVGGYDDSATSIVVDATVEGVNDGAYAVRTGVLLRNEATSEIMYVAAVPASDTTITITRGFGETAAATIADDAQLTILGTVSAEGAGSPTAVHRRPTQFSNVVQIMKEAYYVTGSAAAPGLDLRTEPLLQTERRDALQRFGVFREETYLFGQLKKSTDPVSGKLLYMTRGIIPTIQTLAPSNVLTSFGALTYDKFLANAGKWFKYNGVMTAFIDRVTATALDKMAAKGDIKINADSSNKSYGLSIKTVECTAGVLHTIIHPRFVLNPSRQGVMLLVDTRYISERIMRPVKFEDNIQAPDEDSIKGQWICETGLEVNHAEAHHWVTGITSV